MSLTTIKSKRQPDIVLQSDQKRSKKLTSSQAQFKSPPSKTSFAQERDATDCGGQAFVIEDSADALLQEPRFEAGTLLFETVISFDVPNYARTEAASETVLYTTVEDTDFWSECFEAPMQSQPETSFSTYLKRGRNLSGEDQINRSEHVNPPRVPVEDAVLNRLDELFQDSPSESLKVLAGTYRPRFNQRANFHKLVSDVKCVSPASLANVRPSTTFALCRYLLHEKRASIVDSPDGYLMHHLVNQPTRVLRLIFSFASSPSYQTSESSSTVPEEESLFRQFAHALLKESQKDSAVERQKKYIEFRQNMRERKKMRREGKKARYSQIYGIYDETRMTPSSGTASKRKANKSSIPKPAAKAKGRSSTDGNDSESSDDDDQGNGKDTLDVDSSKLHYSFSKIRKHVPTDRFHITLSVKLSSHAFSIPRSLKRLYNEKQSRLKRGCYAELYDDRFNVEYYNEDTTQNRTEVTMTTILKTIFPHHWDYCNPVTSGPATDEDKSSDNSKIPPRDVPWERSRLHPSSKRPVNNYKGHFDSVSDRYDYKREKTEEEFADELSAWEDLQSEPPRDSRVPPPWVRMSLRGSTCNGNGGWAHTSVTGADLSQDLLADSWRLPYLFPFNADTQQSSIETLMNELESLGHRTMAHPSGMNVVLRDYQLGSISWMVDQERLPGGIHSHLFAPVITADKRRLWYSPILETFRKEKPPSNVCGGFLADEMGLGKTVMVLGLVLSNPAPLNFLHACPYNAGVANTEVHDIESRSSSSNSSNSSSDSSSSSSNNSADNYAAVDESPGGATSHLTPLIRTRATLVVCNVSLVGQWYDEASSKLASDQLRVYKYYGPNRTRDPAVLANYDIVVTTYAILASDLARSNAEATKGGDCNADEEGSNGIMKDEEAQCEELSNTDGAIAGEDNNSAAAKPEKKAAGKASKAKSRSFSKLSVGESSHPTGRVHWWRIVLDESHNIKDPTTMANKACTGLTSGRRWCVSGTPMTKNLSDLVGQFKFLGLAPLHKPAAFQAIAGHSFKLLALLRRILIRHSKGQRIVRKIAGNKGTSTIVEEPILELPPLSTESIPLDLNSSEKSAYSRMADLARNEYLALRQQGEAAVRTATLTITERILRPLRQACSGGDMVFKSNSSKSVISTGSVGNSSGSSESSEATVVMKTKLEALLAHVSRVKADDPTAKCLIFTQFKPTLDLVCKELPQRGFAFRTLTGDMSQQQREEALLSFRDDPPTTVFVLSIRAGAVGINLTEANHVFFLEPLLNPGLEKQAIGRVHRMGQRRAVTVTKFFVNDSIESRLVQLLNGNQPSNPAAAAPVATTAVTSVEGNESSASSSTSASTATAASSSGKKTALVKQQQQVVGHLRADEAILSVEVLDFLLEVTPQHIQASSADDTMDVDNEDDNESL